MTIEILCLWVIIIDLSLIYVELIKQRRRKQ